jgi:uncharacterized protein (DUF3084 family)
MIHLALYGFGTLITSVLLGIVTVAYRKYYHGISQMPKAAFFDDLDARLITTKNELEELKPELEIVTRQYNEALVQKGQAELELETHRSEVTRLRDEVQSLKPTLEDLRKAREELDRTSRDLAKEQKTLNDVIERLGRSRSELAAVERAHSLHEKSLNKAIKEMEKLQESLPALRTEKTSLDHSISENRTEKKRLETILGAIKKDIGKLEEEKRNLESQLSCTQTELESLMPELVRLKGDLRNKNNEINQLNEETTRLKRERDLANDEYQRANAQSKLQKQDLQTLKDQLGSVKHQKEKTENEYNRLQQQIAEQQGQLAGLQSQEQTLKSMVNSLEGTVEALGLRNEVNASESLKDLCRGVPLVLRSGNRVRLNETSLLESLPEKLMERGLQYSERVLWSFHTSLKVSDYNQLTVLAGISGTGKSALPAAYASSMGIHFLPVTVQPGWAGPQDLIGFFNYLERKYKATDLARAMVQFSRFAERDLPGLELPEDRRPDELLLVLLDEMNLARVEYYFSEFLSRLEQRQHINENNLEARHRAAIAVDTGPLRNANQRFFLYPDTNLLFVGTMNEDESTQTLSDKVLDRANLLRFGAPDRLIESRPGDTGIISVQALKTETWKRWCTETVSIESRYPTFDADLRSLNAALERIGSPFGHRVYNAIRRYVEAFPSVFEDQVVGKIAMADQLEQKILPKLRGLDTQEGSVAFREINDLIAKLEDPILSDAYNKAKSKPFFEWQGLKRPLGGDSI